MQVHRRTQPVGLQAGHERFRRDPAEAAQVPATRHCHLGPLQRAKVLRVDILLRDH